MSKKRSFLSPLAVTLAALIGTTKADATPAADGVKTGENKDEKAAVVPFQLPEFLKIERSSVTGDIMAYHTSHRSHQSHSSHRSHYSSR